MVCIFTKIDVVLIMLNQQIFCMPLNLAQWQ